jgi:glycosyltransferase involved in cell wall biosynthesis
VIEAYAAGVPVIATALGALPEMIEHDVTGMLVRGGSAQAWIEAAGALSEDQNSARLGEGALDRWARLHRPEKGLLELEGAYRTALRAPGPMPPLGCGL